MMRAITEVYKILTECRRGTNSVFRGKEKLQRGDDI